MDPRTAIVAIYLQLRDIAEILNGLKDTQKPADNERASLETIQRSLVQQLATLEGQVLVIKLLKAEFEQRTAYKMLLDEEKQAIQDHELAMRMAGMTANSTQKISSTDYKAQLDAASGQDDSQWETAKQLYEYAFEGADVHSAVAEEIAQSTADDCAHTHDAMAQEADTAALKSKGSHHLQHLHGSCRSQ